MAVCSWGWGAEGLLGLRKLLRLLSGIARARGSLCLEGIEGSDVVSIGYGDWKAMREVRVIQHIEAKVMRLDTADEDNSAKSCPVTMPHETDLAFLMPNV